MKDEISRRGHVYLLNQDDWKQKMEELGVTPQDLNAIRRPERKANEVLTEKFKKISRIAILTACGVLLVYDIVAQLWGGTNATISRAIWDLSSEAPFIPFLAGFFAGHLFWPGKHSKFDGPVFK